MTMARRRVPSSGFRPTQESAPVGQYDWGLIALFLMLLCIGLLMVLSASGVVAERINGDKYFFFKRQLIYAVIGGVVMWVLAAVPRHILYKFQYPFLLFVLMLLFVTLSPLGARVNGLLHEHQAGAGEDVQQRYYPAVRHDGPVLFFAAGPA